MTRVAIYARFSSDQQRDASIEDQTRICQAEAERRGWTVVDVFADPALSGASTLRPGYQALLEAARLGAIDLALAEGLDRLSRDQADIATLYKLLAFHGVTLFTVAEGEITELHVGLKGAMNALYLKDLAQKTHRGLEGRVLDGRSGGGLCYGYATVPGETGKRRVVEEEAQIIRRIFERFSAGESPRAIAKALNADGILGPRGNVWRDTAIRGHRQRGTGILNNELYIGWIVWNRLAYVRDPATGKRVSRLRPETDWVRVEAPELRIVPDDLWQSAKARQAEIDAMPGRAEAKATEFWKRRRPHHLLTGKVVCGDCGSRFASIGRDYLACSAARGQGACGNSRSIKRPELEALILEGLKQRLMAPDLVEVFVKEATAEFNRLAAERNQSQHAAEKRLIKVEEQLASLVDAIATGLRSPTLQAKLDALEAEKAHLMRQAAEAPAPTVRLLPNLASLYRERAERLAELLQDPDYGAEAKTLVRSLIEQVVVKRDADDQTIELIGDIVAMIGITQAKPSLANAKRPVMDEALVRSVQVVAGAGFEPATFRL